MGNVRLELREVRQLAYAENLDQNPAELFAADNKDPLAMHKFEVVSGDPSYIAIADASRLLYVLCLLAKAFRLYRNTMPFIVIAGKHGNPCGAAISWSNQRIAIEKALRGDPLAVMGGEVISNFPITDDLGHALFAPTGDLDIGRKNWGLDLVIAPGFSSGAAELLGKREKRRLLSNQALSDLDEEEFPSDYWVYRQVRSGFLRQRAPNFILNPKAVEFWAGEPLSDQDFETLLVAWAVAWRASSNSVALAKDRMLIALGCGQQDRIACVRLCLERANRAGHDVKGSLFASDGFFPYARSQPRAGLLELTKTLISRCEAAWGAYEATLDEERGQRDLLKELAATASAVTRVDNREGPELLIDAGCKGGVVPADGKNLSEVKALFEEAGLSVAFVAKEHRGFANH